MTMNANMFYLIILITTFPLQARSSPCLTCFEGKTATPISSTTILPTTVGTSRCKVILHESSDQQGDKTEITNPNGISNLEIHEEMAQTFGSCCWRIYKYVAYYLSLLKFN